MVLEVEYPRVETPFVSILEEEAFERRNMSVMSCQSNCRDTSTSPRDTLEELRQSHTSILNITTDAEDSDDDDVSHCSEMFAELNEPPILDENPSANLHAVAHENPKPVVVRSPEEPAKKNAIVNWFDNSVASFTDSLCPGTVSEAPCGSFQKYGGASGDRSLQQQMELDIVALLGCYDDPTDEELDTWATPLLCPVDYGNQLRFDPNRNNMIRARANRIHRFRTERHIRSPERMKKCRSLDNSMLNETTVSTETSFNDALGSFLGLDNDLPFGKGIDRVSPEEEDGYDSDPGEMSFGRNTDYEKPREVDDPLDVSAISLEVEAAQESQELIEVIQESLNFIWTLTWHPSKANMEALGVFGKKTLLDPTCVQLWFERGHILHGGYTIVEPQFMWRPLMPTGNQRTGITKPYHMRLLNVCRALPVVSFDRSQFPFARTPQSFILRMVDGQELVFEASSESERDLILQRWKLVVARLATLAVFEDIDAMSKEFFNPTVNPQTLTFD